MNRRTTLLHVADMSCASCVRHVEEAIRAVPGVAEVRVDLIRGEAEVTHDDDVPLSMLLDAVFEAGYSATPA